MRGNWLSRKEQSFLQSEGGLLRRLLGIDLNPRFGTGSRMMHPESPFLVLCNVVSCVCLLWTLMVEQIEIGFYWHTELCDHDLDVVKPMNMFVDVWFLLEIFLSFGTGIYVEGRYVDNFRQVVKAYLAGQFWFDILTCAPGALIQESLTAKACSDELHRGRSASGSSVGNGEERFLFVLRLLRPLRMFRMMKMIKVEQKIVNMKPKSGVALIIVDWLSRQVPPFFFPICACFVRIFLIVHTCVCLFWLVKEATCSQEDISDFIESFGLPRDAGFLERYTLAFYFVNTIFTTVGFGDVTPVTNSERLATIFLMYVGVFVFSLLLSEVQEAVTEFFLQNRNLSKVIMRTKLFLNAYEVPPDLSQRVLSWVEYDFKIQHEHEYLHETLRQVPRVMRRILFSRLHRDLLYKVRSLSLINSNHREDLLVDLFACLKPKTLPRFLPVTLQSGRDSLHCIIKGVVLAEIKVALSLSRARALSISLVHVLSVSFARTCSRAHTVT